MSNIRELENVEDFKKVYMVFSGPPYNEKYTDEELENLFNDYKKEGFIYGAYVNNSCVGLVAVEIGARQNQPIEFEQSKKVMYLADVAVLDKYRRKGLGNQLMLYAIMQSKLLGYDELYMRTLQKGSMSANIAKRLGFKEIPNVIQTVERERVNGSIESMDNIFLKIDLKEITRDSMLQAINSTKMELVDVQR